jgi:hypothetical protein
MTIRNQKPFPPRLSVQPQEATKKIQKGPPGETLTQNHKGRPSPICDGGNPIASEALTGAKQHWFLPERP